MARKLCRDSTIFKFQIMKSAGEFITCRNKSVEIFFKRIEAYLNPFKVFFCRYN